MADKKIRIKSETKTEEQPFTKPGECLDEVTFKFDDGNKLYVSENFLRYVSPVFRAMFEHNWEEKKTRIVNIKGKDYIDFLEFLLCLHPDVQKPVGKKNVLQIVHLAEEYQAGLIIQRCKGAMTAWLRSELDEATKYDNDYYLVEKIARANTCLEILLDANSLNYQDIVEEACSVIGRFGHAIFTGTLTSQLRSLSGEKDDPITSCRNHFNKLPQTLKYNLLLTRLRLVDNTKMK